MDVVQALQFSTAPQQDFKTWLDLKGPEVQIHELDKNQKGFSVFRKSCLRYFWLFS